MARKLKQQETEVITRLISASKLRSLLSSAQKASEDCAEINAALGNEIKTAKERHNLHGKAFSTIKGVMNWEPEKLREFWDNLLFYWEASGLEKRAESAPRLSLGDEPEDNVHQLPGAAE